MISEKRIRKPPSVFFVPVLNILKRRRKRKGKSKKQKLKGDRCRYQIIPAPSKYSFSSNTHVLYGDIVLINQNNTFLTDLCLLNNFKKYRHINVNQIGSERVVNILPTDVKLSTPSDWKSLTEELQTSKDEELKEWGKTIQNFCEEFELLRDEQTLLKSQKTIKEIQAEFKINKLSAKKTLKLFETYPCICLKRRFNEQAMFHLAKIIFSERHFCRSNYKRRHPTVDRIEKIIENNQTAKFLIQDLFNGQKGITNSQPFEFTSFLMLKCQDYIREVRCQIHHFVNYENGLFGMDTIIAVISKESPQINPKPTLNYQISSDFLQAAIYEDEEAANFFETYYNETKFQRYKCMDKVCKVKDILIKTEQDQAKYQEDSTNENDSTFKAEGCAKSEEENK